MHNRAPLPCVAVRKSCLFNLASYSFPEMDFYEGDWLHLTRESVS
jgi:hypothetical protein